MNIQTIHEHSIDLDLLSGGICIDAGCRGFLFSEAMRDLGLKVIAFDLEDMEAPVGIEFKKMAVSNYTGYGVYKDTTDLQAKHLTKGGSGKPVSVVSLNDVYKLIGSNNVDVLKLDIEGEEFSIFMDETFQPIPRQITFELHQHTQARRSQIEIDSLFNKLKTWYDFVHVDYSEKHGCGLNWWDVLIVKR
jgi:FkbM family methyltransferase